MRYTKKTSIKGREMYYKENKLISVREIPQVVLNNMVEGTPYEYVIEGPQVIDKNCIFCGMYSNLQRLVSGKIVSICEEHYYSKNMGQTAQRMKELQNAT